jgi:serine kinase of HPr protein (carbohydrate metabolism regulator)
LRRGLSRGAADQARLEAASRLSRLALIDEPGHWGCVPAGPVRARLVSDDQVRLMQQGPHIVMSPPAGLAGLLEVRGIGIVRA